MFKYLIFFAATFYLVLLIGGEDRGQQRMGLTGAYAAAIPVQLAPTQAPPAPAAPETATAAVATPADSLRILPLPEAPVAEATLQDATLTAAPAPDPFNNPTVTLRTITAEAANVRASASRNAAVIGRLERGEIVQMLEQTGDWVHIRIEGDGIDGFVHRRLISSDAPGLTTSTLFPIAD
ncbi:MAG: hypothetical protein Q27BPR15_10605 [Rhodobacter sp. CACIA14H1]|nr:MAG: hypothetical protein Q27BPR15_10605 [Rhodobacter sp. CACIA14H1]